LKSSRVAHNNSPKKFLQESVDDPSAIQPPEAQPFECFAHGEKLIIFTKSFYVNEYMSLKFNYFAPKKTTQNQPSTRLSIAQKYLSVLKGEE